ncbi:MAG: putative sulfate exporter family transporter [Alphaproteobacteria bacterium]|nr:putative sulfate exporter family transporter [Alphaproteobacteria bacterium]
MSLGSAQVPSAWTRRAARARALLPGIFVAGIIALAAQFISDHYGAPAMLMALLFGMALNFLREDATCAPGIAFSARTVLRLGVGLLGLRISVDMVLALGADVILLVVGGVVATICFGLLAARFFGFRYRFAFLSAGAVAICGASAALAIAAVLPKDERSEERLVFTVVGVTVLSTVAMVLYPIAATAMGMDHQATGVFLGATIHDVAQVVGAGFSVSDAAGETATLVKLMRVSMLTFVVLAAALLVRRMAADHPGSTERPPLLPWFVALFLVLVAVNSADLLPAAIPETANAVSRAMLLMAIAAVGLKTSLGEVVGVGLPAMALLVAETLFLAALVAVFLVFVL